MKKFIDVVYDPVTKMHVSIFTPDKPQGCPVIVHAPGAGFVKCTYNSVGLVPLMFSTHNVILVTVQYRVLPVGIYPVPMDDVADAFGWVRLNIAKYGGDPNSCFLMGHSAGAIISSMVAVKETIGIKGAILVEGCSDFKVVNDVEPRRWKKARLEFPGRTDDQIFKLSPIYHIGINLPKHLLIYADQFAWTRISAINFDKAIRDKGLSSTLYHASGDTHTSVMSNLAKPGDKTAAAILDFVSNGS